MLVNIYVKPHSDSKNERLLRYPLHLDHCNMGTFTNTRDSALLSPQNRNLSQKVSEVLQASRQGNVGSLNCIIISLLGVVKLSGMWTRPHHEPLLLLIIVVDVEIIFFEPEISSLIIINWSNYSYLVPCLLFSTMVHLFNYLIMQLLIDHVEAYTSTYKYS